MAISKVNLKSQCTNVPVDHCGLIFKNQTLEWLPSDTKESYDRMMLDSAHREYFTAQGWHKPGAISYRINSDGFRGEEFDTRPGLIALGCSYTIGIGLPEHTVWPWQVGQALNYTVANLAWGGNSADACVRMAAHWVPKLRPKLVVLLTPPPDRFEIFYDYSNSAGIKMQTIYPQAIDANFAKDFLLRHYYLHSENSAINRLKNQLAIQQICELNGAACLIYCCFDAFARSREEVGYARDYLHAGIQGHTMLANQILKDYREINIA